ncbi:MAG: ribbon-helix-helix protein, CopG family [Sciscionella sp.]|nr:ribbon-helix-helix protein, CopG family [Sciscionella sp.]
MRTLYVRNVQDEVVEAIERLAAANGMSVSVFVARELTEVARRAKHPALLGLLPNLDVDTDDLLADLDAERAAR